MILPTVFLSSLDSERLSNVRQCRVTDLIMFDSGKPAITASIDPPIVGQDFNRDDISFVVLAARHEGTDLLNIAEFPCFVFVCIPALPDRDLSAPIRADDLQVIGWGELYRSAEDAETRSFD